ncbi:MTAP family purine nucleoside phosphorylase [Sphaerochaeta sp.]|jgi:purine nucleoside phosphorylase|uniref:MTAP family purine nucleoside phosphorylase n=1 Tax=Sphaerochaeta sp. TaxID=1972642 RepID=UPI002FC7FEF3
MKAIIGGTGVDTLDGYSLQPKQVITDYGKVEVFLGAGRYETLVFLPRHGSQHSLPPHMINYRANVAALRQLGVEEAIGIYAVGSISAKLEPGCIGLVSDFIDLSGGSRANTFFTGGEHQVVHVAMDEVFDQTLQQRLLHLDPSLVDAGVYACTNGPRLETKAEIRYLASLGCDIVGMTLATEVSLLREAGTKTAALAYSINWAAGIQHAVAFIDDAQIARLKDRMTHLCLDALLNSSR